MVDGQYRRIRRHGANRRRTESGLRSRVGVLVLAFAVSFSPSSYAEQDTSSQAHQHPRFTERCQALAIARVPDRYADFERRVMNWMATCVTSRSADAHREVELVSDNRSLYALWRTLVKGKPARIVPHYTWGEFRVTRVTFSAPTSRQKADGNPTGRPPGQAGTQTGNGPTPRPTPDGGTGSCTQAIGTTQAWPDWAAPTDRSAIAAIRPAVAK